MSDQRRSHGIQRWGRKTLATECRHRVVVRRPVRTPDGRGGFSTAYVNADTVWVGIAAIGATKQAEYRTLNIKATHWIRFRGGLDIREDDHIAWGTRVFEVETIEDFQERGIMKLAICVERR